MRFREAMICLCLAALVGAAAGHTFGASVSGAEGKTASKNIPQVATVSMLSNGEQRLANYDYECRIPWVRSKHFPVHRVAGIEWPMSMLFLGDATVEKVRKLLHGAMDQVGADACASFVTATGQHLFVTSKGLKTDECAPMSDKLLYPYDYHIRLYGPQTGSDPNYRALKSRSWGHWVVGATHADRFDCPFYKGKGPNATYGEGREAADAVAYYLYHVKHCQLLKKEFVMHNENQGGRGPDRFDSNGLAWTFVIPHSLKYSKATDQWSCR